MGLVPEEASPARGAVPRIANRYRIEGELGRGGLGAVYRAYELLGGRFVALKTLEQVTPLTTTLFEREYHVLASLEHPSVIQVFDFGLTDDGSRYYTMEILPGQDLAQVSPLPWRDACRHIRDIAASLALLHGRRLLHRDVSPRNIRFDGNGRAKLLDFGALTPFGMANEIVGTPTCIAPEAVQQLDLDQRSDLFSLGVVFYLGLTGKKPFLVKSLREVEAAVAVRPAAPSDLVPEIPRALDQLILSMLSAEREGRPTTAAEVMERVCAIAKLDGVSTPGVAESHLLGTALCGRDREKEQLSLHVQNAMRGEGGVVVVEATTGMGKSRLVRELLIDASLAGMTTLRVDALAHSEPLGLIRALGSVLIEKSPVEALEALKAHLPVLWQALPEARRHMRAPSEPPAPLPDDVNERRARVQHHFVRWMLGVAARKPVLVVVDDAHAADSTSAGVLSELAHFAWTSRLLLVTTELLGAESPVAIRQLARVGARIKLRALSQSAVEHLVEAAFGEVPNRARLTQWLFEVGRGNPGQSLSLLSHLLETGVIRYAEGTWSLPAELADSALPASVEDVLRARVRELEPTALRLARLLAVHRGPLRLSVQKRSLVGIERSALFTALDALSMREMLVASGETHRLADEALRAVLLEGLSVQQIRELHLSLGQALADSLAIPPGGSLAKATAAELLVLLQAGFHFAEAHDDPGGRGLLSEAGIELTHRGEGLAAAIPALETALRSYVEAGRSAFDRALLMFPLTLAGSYVDFRLTYRYGEELIGFLADIAGMTLASRLRRYLGGKLAFAVGLGVGILRYPLIARSKSRRRFHELFLGLISMTTAIVAVATPLLDRALARRALRRIDPLRSLPMSVPARLVYEFALSMSEGIDGHFAVARTRARFVLLRMRRPGGVRFMPEDARVQLELGILMFVGSIEAMRTDGAVHGTLAALDSHVTANARQVAAGVRATYHAHRGERALFEEQQREVDALAAGVGSTWRQDVLLARNGWWPHAMCEDVMGLKHCVRQLDSMSQDAPSLTLMRDAAHASYLGARGMHREALQKYEKVLAAGAEPATELSMRLIATLARLLRLSDRSVEAEALCRRALGAMTTAQLEFAALVHSVQLEHALSLFSLERRDESIELLEELLVAQQAHDNALLRGLTHKARAQVALALGEAATFRGHLSSMGEWFRLTENPSLIAQLHSLEDEGARAGFLPDARHQAAIVRKVLAGNEATIRATFGRCRGPSDRLQTALNMVIDATSAERGYLYLLNEEGGLRFAAPVVGLEPPDDLKRELAEQLDVFRQKEDVTSGGDGAEPSGMRTVVGDEDRPAVSVSPVSAAPPVSPATYRSVFLAIPREGRFVAVGAVALVAGAEPLRAIDVATLEEIARGIYDAADVQTVFFGAEPRNASSSRSQGSGPPRSGPDSVKTRLEAPAWHGSRTAGRKFVPG